MKYKTDCGLSYNEKNSTIKGWEICFGSAFARVNTIGFRIYRRL